MFFPNPDMMSPTSSENLITKKEAESSLVKTQCFLCTKNSTKISKKIKKISPENNFFKKSEKLSIGIFNLKTKVMPQCLC